MKRSVNTFKMIFFVLLTFLFMVSCLKDASFDKKSKGSDDLLSSDTDGSNDEPKSDEASDEKKGDEKDKSENSRFEPPPPGKLIQSSVVTQNNITFKFDKDYPVGQFVNGDYFVVAKSVKIVSISPDASDGRNGWEVNRTETKFQPYDSRANWYDAKLQPSLPYEAIAPASIVKTISGDLRTTNIDWASVLTVLAEAPVDNGATVFRPPYFGTNKPLIGIGRLRFDFLPQYELTRSAITLEDLRKRYERVQFMGMSGWVDRSLHPRYHMIDYGAAIGRDAGDAVLRLMGPGTNDEKFNASIGLIQSGIDHYYAYLGGLRWRGEGGHNLGVFLPMVLTSVLLDDEIMKEKLRNSDADDFAEKGLTHFNAEGVALYGNRNCTEKAYWDHALKGVGAKDCKDPYGQIDGGVPDQSYVLLTAKMFKGTALALLLMPKLREVWNHEAFISFTARWKKRGANTLPDKCAFQDPGPTYSGVCIPGTGRYNERHGKSIDSGYYYSLFSEEMWEKYYKE